VQHHYAKRRIDAVGIQRQFEGIASAKFDIPHLALPRNGTRSPQHLIGEIDADNLAGKTRQFKGQAPGAAANIREREIPRQQLFNRQRSYAVVKITLANPLPVAGDGFKVAL
jgi:hypothetical protein